MGEVKDQKLSVKQFKITKPEFKQQYLQPIQCLPANFQVEILTKVINKEMSFQELKSAAQEYRKLETIKRTFCRLTNSSSIEVAMEKYPNHANDDKFRKFIHLDFSTTPSVFHSYCRTAVSSVGMDADATGSSCQNVSILCRYII